MRHYAILKKPFALNGEGDLCRRLILDEMSPQEVFVYLSVSTEDDGCSYDWYFTCRADALEALRECGGGEGDLIPIEDPPGEFLRSFIRPLRLDRSGGKAVQGRYERYTATGWEPFTL